MASKPKQQKQDPTPETATPADIEHKDAETVATIPETKQGLQGDENVDLATGERSHPG